MVTEGTDQLYRMGHFSVDGGERFPLRLGYEARLDGGAVIDRLARELPPRAADLIEIAAMAYAADRLARRPHERRALDGSGWDRHLWLRVPVRDPESWTAACPQLTDLLEWLTDDEWELEFCQLPRGAGSLDSPQGFLFDTVPQGAPPALFSGGLDSAIGLASTMHERELIAVSVHTNFRMRSTQQRLVRGIAASGNCVHLQYRISLSEPECESSQRTRGLVFLAVGIGTAWALGQDRLRVFENGVGAINLPYLRSQHGSQATRSMHPRTLTLAERLAWAVSARPFRIEAPFLLATKAEAVRSAPGMSARLIAATVSCDTGFAARVSGVSHCGACTSCLLRRHALIAAGRSDADTATRYRTVRPVNTGALSAMACQADRIKAVLDEPEPWRRMVAEFPTLLDASPLTPREVTRLYRAYVDEWAAVGPEFWLQPDDRSAA